MKHRTTSRQTSILFAVIVSSIQLLSFTGCGRFGIADRFKSKTPETVILCLFDISGSTWEGKLRGRYFDQFKNIVLKAPDGSSILAAAISNNPWTTPGQSVSETLPLFDMFSGITSENKRKNQSLKKKLIDDARNMIEGSTGEENTALIDTLGTVEKMMMGDSFLKYHDKRLVIFSDMVEQTSDWDFSSCNWNDKEIERIIGELKASGRIPNLKGLKIWVAGAGRTASGDLNPKTSYGIQRFWLRFFKETGGSLDITRYGNELYNYK